MSHEVMSKVYVLDWIQANVKTEHGQVGTSANRNKYQLRTEMKAIITGNHERQRRAKKS
jgi:hypothetical protein